MRLRYAFVSLFSGNVLVTGANLVRDITLAAAFGVALQADILFLAISIPVFILTVGSNGFRSVVVPALSRVRALSEARFRQVSARFVLVAAIVAGIVAAGLALLSGGIYFADVPGVPADTRQLFAVFLLAILPMYVGSALVEVVQGPLQVVGGFLVPSLLRLGLPLGIVAGVLLLPEARIFGASAGGALGMLVVLPVAIYLLRQHGMAPGPRTPPLPEDVRNSAVTGYRAIVAATMITYANPMVDQWVASLGGAGAPSMLGYANRLMTGVVALVAGAVSQVLLIHLSRQVGAGDRAGLSATYRLLTRVMPWVGCLATLGVWLTSDFLVALLYQRGSFDAADTAMVADLVNRYALQFPVFWAGIAGGTLVWALSMNQILVPIGVILFVANVLGDLVFQSVLGVPGIPLSTTVVLLISVLLVNRALKKANRLEIRLVDWASALIPVSLLALVGLVVSRYDIGVAPSPDLSGTLLALSVLAAFAVCGAPFVLREYSLYEGTAGRRAAT